MNRCAATLAITGGLLFTLLACQSEPRPREPAVSRPRRTPGSPRKKLFHFDVPDASPRETLVTDQPLENRDASYTVPARRMLLTYNPRYSEYASSGVDPYLGPHQEAGSLYEDVPEASPYYLERTGEPILPDGEQGLRFVAEASRTTIPSAGATVWARVLVSAPSYVPARPGGLNLALVFDLTDSMGEPGKIEALRRIARGIVSQLVPGDRVALVAYGPEARVLRPTGSVEDRARLLAAVDSLVIQGGDDIGGALSRAFAEARLGRDQGGTPGHVILISDGKLDAGGGWRVEDLARSERARGGRLSAIAVGEDARSGLLVDLARAGGGRFAYVSDASAAPEVLASEMRGVLRSYAEFVRLRVSGESARVLNVLGSGIRNASPGASDIVLADIAAGETRSLVVRLRVAPGASAATTNVDFRLVYTQIQPVRRTTRDTSITFHTGEAAGEGDALIEAHAKIASGLDLIDRALRERSDSLAHAALDLLEGDFNRIRGVAFAEGDSDLVRDAALFEEFAGRLRRILEGKGLRGEALERERLRSEFLYRYG